MYPVNKDCHVEYYSHETNHFNVDKFKIDELSSLQSIRFDIRNESIDKFQFDVRMITNEIHSMLVGEAKLFPKFLPESIIKDIIKKISNIDDNFRKRFAIHQTNLEKMASPKSKSKTFDVSKDLSMTV
uniref:Uncharacterized protein LOC113793085 n=1 Tax=Dermatophagoides pteronyssinus TaxID=6956 RepID=A0A6P6Y169_DERPT|nr:uncharacterized protein LOC113793085 [Dermatophagoides pteronyssinus]